MPALHIIDGKEVVLTKRWLLGRFFAFLAAPFLEALRHRDLIAAILRRELQERFKASAAGWVWAATTPFLSLITYTVAFGGAIKLPGNMATENKGDYALFIFGGLVAFNFFTEVAYRAPSLLHEYSHFIKQTMFPAEMLPIISTFRATVYACISLTMMLVAQTVIGGGLHWTVLALPLWLIAFVAFLIGLMWLLSAVGAFTRDVSYLIMTVVPLLMFVTPVFFSQASLSPRAQFLMYLNPIAGFIEVIRDLVVLGVVPEVKVCVWTALCSAVSFWFGFWFFRRQRDGIADVI